jgi:hypothetical protein
MPELEQTRQAAPAAVPVQPLGELERTQLARGPDLPAQALPELERTQLPKAPNAPAPPVPDLDLGRAPDDGVRTAAPTGAATCRYCRNVQASGLVCDKCGMRLPKVIAPAAAPAKARGRDDEPVYVRCKCGVRTRAGEPCNSCAVMVPWPEA